MALHGVIFDLGGTLVEYESPQSWEGPGLEAFRQALVKFGYQPPPIERLLETHVQTVMSFHERLTESPDANMTQDEIFLSYLEEAGIKLRPAEWNEACERYYQESYKNSKLVPGACDTLAALQKRGLRLGALSNTQWPGERLDHMLDLQGIGKYFEARFYSSEERAWKPWPAIFERALHSMNLTPEETAYVGDTPIYDMQGARGVGMRAVWFDRGRGLEPSGETPPDAAITELPALLDVVDEWQAG
jgi:HAD superfamily hydrolase (TIGR01662 family)